MRLIAYYRCSTFEQLNEGLSIQTQRARLAAWATACGHEIIAEAEDGGVSASIPPFDRPGFGGAVGALRNRKAEGICAVALDRIARSVTDTLELSEVFVKNEWSLLSMRESLDQKTATGRFTLTILAAAAELERGLAAERTREGLMQVRREGRRYSRHVPFGRTLMADGSLKPNPVEEQFLRTAIERAQEGMEQYDIAAHLNEHLGPHPRLNVAWNVRRVAGLMRSAVRLGLIPKKWRRTKRPRRKKEAV